MPPANSPAAAPSTLESATNPQSPRPLTPLSYLDSPVPDLASTLHSSHTSQAAEEAHEANVRFLRESLDQPAVLSQTFVDPARDPRRSTTQPIPVPVPATTSTHTQPLSTAPRYTAQETAEDFSRRERLQRVLARLNRLHDPPAAASSASATAYTNRTPSPHVLQSLYDWAPSYDEQNREDDQVEAILNDLRAELPSQSQSQSQVGGQRAGAQDSSRRRENEWVSLRARAAIQRARSGEGSPSATDRMLRYVMERERSGMSEEEERARGAGWFRPNPTSSRVGNGNSNGNGNTNGHGEQRGTATASSRDLDSWLLPPPASSTRDRDRAERVDAFRRGYLAENTAPRLPRILTPPPAPAAPPSHATAVPSSTTLAENALKYLNDLRECSQYEDSLSAAIDHGLATKEFFADKHDDFIMDLQSMEPLQYTSWLQPGTVFDGHQHATSSSASSSGGGLTHHGTNRAANNVTHVVEQINPHFDHPPGSTRVAPPPSFDAARPWLSHQFTPPTPLGAAQLNLTASKPGAASDSQAGHDHWPVRVILHAVDAEAMTLQGTMEAYDVPQQRPNLNNMATFASSATNPPTHNTGAGVKAGKKSAPITTYLEGQIIDLKTHSFLTPSHPSSAETRKPLGMGAASRSTVNTTTAGAATQPLAFPAATPHTDATNWLKLPPFSHLPSSDELARVLLSQARMQEIHTHYIFMRWKERCFIHSSTSSISGSADQCTEPPERRTGDQDRGHGLTISGFYYVSLRRADGVVEGLYFDPSSTPYQHLRLCGGQGVGRGGWPSFGFA